MGSLLARRPDFIYILVAGYCLLSVILKVLRPDSLEIDESEQAFLSQYLMLGYGAQPPLYNWLQYALVTLLGVSVASLAVLKNALLLLFLLIYGFAVRVLTGDRGFSAVAILGVLTLPPVFLLSQRDLTHTVAALFAVSLFLYGLFRVLKNPPHLSGYLVVGIAVGLGAISKYNFIVVPFAAILAILPEATLRKRLFDWRILASFAVCAVIVAPHTYWIVHNLDQASGVTIAEMKEGVDKTLLPHAAQGLFSLAVAALKGVALTIVVFAAVFHTNLAKILRSENEWTRIVGRMLLICFLIIALIVVVMGATHIRQKWLALITVLLPLYLTVKLDAAGVDSARRLPAFLSIASVLSVGVILMLWARVFIGPMVGDYSFAHTPYGAFARTVSATRAPAMIVVDDRILAGNLRIQFPSIPIILPDFLPNGTPQLPIGLVLLAWPAEGKGRTEIPQRLSDFLLLNGVSAAELQPAIVSLPYNAGRAGDEYKFGYAWAEHR